MSIAMPILLIDVMIFVQPNAALIAIARILTNELDLGTLVVLAAVEEPLGYADD